MLVGLNVQVGLAHNWNRAAPYHWHTGSDIRVWVYGTNQTRANSALNDWDSHTDINFPRSPSHTEMSVWGGDFGATGWAGLATIWSNLDSHGAAATHCHARYNKHYQKPWWDPAWWGTSGGQWRQGVFCQEIGHCLGLAHSNDGCMGMGYYNHKTTTNSHNRNDVNAKF